MADPAMASYEEFSMVVDHLWLLICAFMVFLMQAGFGILESGMVRSKNAKNIMVKNVMDACAGAFMWWGFGYAFAYGGGDYSGGPANAFIGASGFFFINEYAECPEGTAGGAICLYGIKPTIDSFAGYLFQWAFVATAATIVAGSVAERCTFMGYLSYTCILSGFIYPVVVHWVWSGYGWLSAFRELESSGAPETQGAWISHGMVDFAGSGVVHITGGCAALVGAIIIGPRYGRFDAEGKLVEFRPHNATFVGLGTLLLWFGWYGFNPGSTLGLSGGFVLVAEKVAVGTTLAAAGGGLAAMLMTMFVNKCVDLPPLCNGILAGLVGVCSAVAVSEPWACFVIGIGSAIVQFWFAILLQKIKIDDPLDASSVHFAAGIFGLICGGLFGTPTNTTAAYSAEQPVGAFFGGNGQQLGVNLLGALMITVWVGGMSTIVFGTLRLAGILRVPLEEELEGLDKSHHGGSAYDMDMMHTSELANGNGADKTAV